MDAQLILDRLRRDLRRLDRATLEQLHRGLGRNARFLQRVEADNFKLQELFALGRMLGYRPSELLRRFGRLSSWEPQEAAAFFRARGSARAGKPRSNLDKFLEWGDLLAGCLAATDYGTGLPPETVLIAIARTYFLAGKTDDALRAIRKAEPLVGADHCFLGDFLWTKAQALSLAGNVSEPTKLLDQASEVFRLAERRVDFALVEIEKCRHWLRFGQRRRAQKQATALLAIASGLDNNSAGKAAIFQLCRDIIAGTPELGSIQKTMHRVQHPNLHDHVALSR